MLYEYCERGGSGLFDEPINLVTNISFLVAAWFVFRLMKSRDAFGSGNVTLLFLMVSIGVGSALYHSFATRWAALCDVVPIFFYQIVFLWLYMVRVVRLGSVRSVLLMAVFLVFSLYALFFKVVLNGSVMYFPALVSVMIVAVYHYFSKKLEPMAGIYALIVFTVSLCFRTVDATLCPAWPYGTHFLWHLFNGLLLYLTSRIIIVNCGLKKSCVAQS